MKTNSNSRPMNPDVTPLLRSIAKEMVSRTMAIAELESRIAHVQSHPEEDQTRLAAYVAALSNHRRELRMVDKELERLGWRRDREQLMTFVQEDGESDQDTSWQLQGTGFYKSLDLSGDD